MIYIFKQLGGAVIQVLRTAEYLQDEHHRVDGEIVVQADTIAEARTIAQGLLYDTSGTRTTDTAGA